MHPLPFVLNASASPAPHRKEDHCEHLSLCIPTGRPHPLLQPVRYMERLRLPATVLVKLESFNPAGSIKDRVALEMIEDAEKEGKLLPGGTIVEPTSGNTGIGLAAMGLARGYQVILTMPESMSLERRQLLAAYGAQLVLTPAKGGMAGAVEKAQEIAAAIPGSFLAGQFDNPANPRAHYRTTGPESGTIPTARWTSSWPA